MRPVDANALYYHLYCSVCDLAFVGNIPTTRELAQKYQDAYADHRYRVFFRADPDRDVDWLNLQAVRAGFAERLGIAELEQAGGKRAVLEVGCAEGRILEMFQRRGWEPIGLDVSRPMVEMARRRGLDVRCGELTRGLFAPGTFRLVFMTHVIEHLRDPVDTLRICGEILEPGGLVMMETPATPIFDDTDHMFFFSERSLDAAARAAGLDKHLHFLTPRPEVPFFGARFPFYARLPYLRMRSSHDLLASYRRPRS